MSNLSLFEKLELKEEKNLLIQGLPSSIEKQFAKLSYAKNVTPLLKNKKVDFALVFAVNQNQLNNVLKDVFCALHDNTKLWVAYPKQTSKIVSDLKMDSTCNILGENCYETLTEEPITLDHCWSAMRFNKNTLLTPTKKVKVQEFEKSLLAPVVDEKVIKIRKAAARKKAAAAR